MLVGHFLVCVISLDMQLEINGVSMNYKKKSKKDTHIIDGLIN